MTDIIDIHPDNPQARLVARVAEVVKRGGVIAYPTDSAYALACQIANKTAVERIRRIRQLDKHHHFTLVCGNLSEVGVYGQMSNPIFRVVKACLPAPYTFILKASSEVPKRLQHFKRKTIGIRIPDHPIVLSLLEELGEPMMSVTLILPGDDLPLSDANDIYDRLQGQVELVVNAGPCGIEPTTVVDLSEGGAKILRVGKGDITPFE